MTPGPETLIPAAVIAIPALLALASGRGGGRTARLHRRNRRKAGKAIRRLNRGDMTPAQKMGYLRRIDPYDVEEFATLCEIRGKRGLFVHTGKTGRKSRELARESRVRVISGDSLLAMIGDK